MAEALSHDVDSAKRVVFNAITEREIREAFEKPRSIDMDRVNAQQARRILDRIVGYQASPLLWKRITSGLSAGRVQSVAVRLVVEREREIRAFVPDEHWDVEADLVLDATSVSGLAEAFAALQNETDADGKGPTKKRLAQWRQDHGAFTAKLVELDGEAFKLGTTSEFPEDLSDHIAKIAASVGIEAPKCTPKKIPRAKARPNSVERSAESWEPVFNTTSPESNARAKSVSRLPRSSPAPCKWPRQVPGLRTKRTMGIAQKLYQNGHITYMRTDSPGLSPEAIEMARTLIDQTYGQAYLPDKPRHYAAKSDGAQEAHEAIRPTNAAVEGKTSRV